jgi:hypothetical protein
MNKPDDGMESLVILRRIADLLVRTEGFSESEHSEEVRNCIQELCAFLAERGRCFVLFRERERDVPGLSDVNDDLFAAAACMNSLAMLRGLLSHHYKPRASWIFGYPEEIAAMRGHVDALKLFNCTWPLDALFSAKESGQLGAFKYLFETYGWHMLARSNRRNATASTSALMSRVLDSWLETPHPGIFDFAMGLRRNPKYSLRSDFCNDQLRGLLHTCAKHGWLEMTKHLISLGVPFRGVHNAAPKVVQQACEEGYSDVVFFLLQHQPTYIHTLEMVKHAAIHGHTQLVRELMDNGAQASYNGIRNEGLIEAARAGYMDIVRILIECESLRCKEDHEAIMAAAEAEHEEMLCYLTKHIKVDDPSIARKYAQQAQDLGLESMSKSLKRWEAEMVSKVSFPIESCS